MIADGCRCRFAPIDGWSSPLASSSAGVRNGAGARSRPFWRARGTAGHRPSSAHASGTAAAPARRARLVRPPTAAHRVQRRRRGASRCPLRLAPRRQPKPQAPQSPQPAALRSRRARPPSPAPRRRRGSAGPLAGMLGGSQKPSSSRRRARWRSVSAPSNPSKPCCLAQSCANAIRRLEHVVQLTSVPPPTAAPARMPDRRSARRDQAVIEVQPVEAIQLVARQVGFGHVLRGFEDKNITACLGQARCNHSATGPTTDDDYVCVELKRVGLRPIQMNQSAFNGLRRSRPARRRSDSPAPPSAGWLPTRPGSA